jgi:hypothetical protein
MALLPVSTNDLREADILNFDKTNFMKYNTNNTHINLIIACGYTTIRRAGTTKFLSLQADDSFILLLSLIYHRYKTQDIEIVNLNSKTH